MILLALEDPEIATSQIPPSQQHSSNSTLIAQAERPNPSSAKKTEDDILLIMDEERESISRGLGREQPISEAPANVYVITDEDIRHSGAIDLPTVLRRIPGIEVMQTTGSEFNVSARGNNQIQANKMLVMVDGRSIYDDEQGVVNWKVLPVSLLEVKRIEVLKGPVSALYGFNAFDGIINIITKSGEEMKGVTLQLGGGGYGTITSSAIVGGTAAKLNYRISTGHDQTSSWSNRDSLAYRSNRFNIHTDYHLSDNSKITVQGGLIDVNKFDGPSAGVVDATQKPAFGYTQVVYERPNFTIRSWWNHLDSSSAISVNPLISQFFRIQDRDGSSTQSFVWDSYNIEAQQTFDISNSNRLIAGANYRHNAVSSNFLSEFGNQNRLGLYLQDELRATNTLTFVGGVRMDLDSFIHPTYSPRAAIVYKPWGDHSFRASISVAYRPPTIFDTFLQSTGITRLPFPNIPANTTQLQGSGDLSPEQIIAYEIGYQGWYFKHRVRIRVDVFYNHVSDLISSVSSASGAPPKFTNGSDADIYGVEPGVEFQVTHWLTGFANMSYLHIRQRFTGDDRRGGPRYKANAGLRTEWDNGISGEASINFVSSAQYPLSDAFTSFSVLPGGQPAPNSTVNSYTLLNLRGAYGFWKEDNGRNKAEIAVTVFNTVNEGHREHPLGQPIGSRIMGWLTLHF